MIHKTVLLNETIDGLNLTAGKIVVDCTFGAGGHSKEIIRRFGNDVKIVAIDLYAESIKECEQLKSNGSNIVCVNSNFGSVESVIDNLGINKVDGFIFDLGTSSDEIEHSGRGFSFMKDEPLLMNFGSEGLTAEEVVNSYAEADIAQILYELGEERFSRQIAKGIVHARKNKRITTTLELVSVIKNSVPVALTRGRLHFATKTFQALRIYVNRELDVLKSGLAGAFKKLSSGGRMCVISFHSLEDRIVKNFGRDLSKDNGMIVVTKKPIIPTRDEVIQNRRSRSAKLRIFSKI
jgi:16S rRNA (cytosine1402-N4)-methyltransferase